MSYELVAALVIAGLALAVIAFAIGREYSELRSRAQARRQVELRSALQARGVRSLEQAPTQRAELASDRQAMHDDCLRRGYPLPEAIWLADRAYDLGRGRESLEQAEIELVERRQRNELV